MFLPDQIEILLCVDAVDMRKGANGLAGLVRDLLHEEPLSNKLFVFRSKRRDCVKILYWHRNGFAVWSKKIQKGTFFLPSGKGSVPLTRKALRLILEGVDLRSFSQSAA